MLEKASSQAYSRGTMERHETGERKWHELPGNIDSEVRQSAQLIDGLDDDGAAKDVSDLNAMLEQSNHTGRVAWLVSPDVVFVKESIQDGVPTIEPVFDSLLLQHTIEGTFQGVDTFMQTEEKRALRYLLTFEQEGELYMASAPVEGALLRFSTEETEDEDPDWLVEQALLTLERGGGDDYRAIVAFLREDYETEDEDRAGRLRAIGRDATLLMACPEFCDSKQAQALHTILMSTLDTELTYTLYGYAADDYYDKVANRSVVFASVEPDVVTGIIDQCVYITNYDMKKDSKGEAYTVSRDGLQPAFRIQSGKGSPLTLPLQYLEQVEYRDMKCSAFNARVRSSL